MKKTTKQKPQEETSIDILKKVAKRVEDATIDIGEMKRSLRFVNLRMSTVESDTGIIKVDVEKIREELAGTETRLNKRITRVADLITLNLGDKLQNHERRIKKIERIQQTA